MLRDIYTNEGSKESNKAQYRCAGALVRGEAIPQQIVCPFLLQQGPEVTLLAHVLTLQRERAPAQLGTVLYWFHLL